MSKTKTVLDKVLYFSVLSSVLFVSSLHAHQGFSNKAASLACEEKELGNICEWTGAHDARYIGTCRKAASALMCVRNKPIIYPEGYDRNEHNSEPTAK